MFFVGDVHGVWGDLNDRLNHTKVKDEKVFLLGDVDIGIYKIVGYCGSTKRGKFYPKTFPDNVKFIRGNHDNPSACAKHPNFLGEYGVIEADGHKIGFLSGGFSIDRMVRVEDVDWWRNEELSTVELLKALELFESEKPDVMISHEAPESLARLMFQGEVLIPTRTSQALDSVLVNVKSIKSWFCGHYHFTYDRFHCGVDFHVLKMMEFRHFE